MEYTVVCSLTEHIEKHLANPLLLFPRFQHVFQVVLDNLLSWRPNVQKIPMYLLCREQDVQLHRILTLYNHHVARIVVGVQDLHQTRQNSEVCRVVLGEVHVISSFDPRSILGVRDEQATDDLFVELGRKREWLGHLRVASTEETKALVGVCTCSPFSRVGY